MKIIADENIALLGHYFGPLGTIIQKPGRSISAEDVHDADILLVRSVTRVDENLLKNSTVKFVGSVTIGVDHLDIDWLNQAGITWKNAEGCNSNAVVNYIICVIAALQKEGFLLNSALRAGLVGVGRIGEAIANQIKLLGFETILSDPFKQEMISHVPFEHLSQLDLISFHTPLTTQGEFPTFHLVNKKFLSQQKKDCVLINTSRGAVFDSHDLKYYGRECLWCFDVWEKEPFIDFSILENAFVATPHIAGYSIQAKIRGTQMIYEALNEWLGQLVYSVSPIEEDILTLDCRELLSWQDIVLKIFDPREMTKQMQFILPEGYHHFDWLRKHFTKRYEFDAVKLMNVTLSEKESVILKGLGFNF